MSDQNNASSIPQTSTEQPNMEQTKDYKALYEEAKRESDGRLKAIQEERERARQLKEEMERVQAAQSQNQPVASSQGDELDNLIGPIAEKRIQQVLSVSRAFDFLAAKTGKTSDDVRSDSELLSKLDQVAKRWGISGDAYSVAKNAYEAMELEKLREAQARANAEANRDVSVEQSQPLGGGQRPVPASTGRVYSPADWNRLPAREFGELSKHGDFVKDAATGNITYVPRS